MSENICAEENVLAANVGFTVIWPGGQITAKNPDDAESQIMNLQDFGSYPLWEYIDFYTDYDEDGIYDFPGWYRFDGALFLGKGTPPATDLDLREYLVWSLNGAIELADVKIIVTKDLEPDER